MNRENNFSITVASVNGSGTQTANGCLAKSIFRHGAYISAKNLFPSNIAGLPTWFTIRTNEKGYVSREPLADIFVARNKDTWVEDLKKVKPGGYFFYDAEWKADFSATNITAIAVPYRELAADLSDSIRLRRLLSNMIYVGLLAELMDLNLETVSGVVRQSLPNNDSIIEANLNAILKGKDFAESLKIKSIFPYRPATHVRPGEQSLLIDGNSAAALGAVVGGCSFVSWYPITPASSLAESFIDFAHTLRPQDEQKNFPHAVIQAEDELAAISMVIGAGWAGARTMTSTSGPGLSLMAEAAGLSYFAEIPAVIWDVQRAGPSTGLPTRTMQGDIEFAYRLSHGDTEHIVLIPSSPEECYEFAQLAFDIAEEFQTLVIVLSDLDLGMNYRMSCELPLPKQAFRRGKVLTAEKLNEISNFARYQDIDGDGVCYRTLPGTMHAQAAYFARGTGHNESAGYSEDGETYKKLLDRLTKKMQTATLSLPQPRLEHTEQSEVLLVSYGSTSEVVKEVQHILEEQNILTSHLIIRALPIADQVEALLQNYKKIIVLEQNRDHQLRNILSARFPAQAPKLHSALSYDGLPPCAKHMANEVNNA